MFVRYRGKTKLMYFKKTDTTLNSSLKAGSLVKITDSGNLTYCKNDSSDRIVGVCRQRVLAVDTAFSVTNNWLQAPFVPVEVPVENSVEWLIDTDSDGGALDSDIGRYCTIDTAGGNSNADSEAATVDVNDTSFRNVLITGVVSGTKVIGVLSKLSFNVQDTV